MKITTFDNIEDFFSQIASQRDAADAQVKSWQEAIKAGDHFIRLMDMEGDGVLVIYGEIEEVEYEEDKELYAQPHMKHYRPSQCYSVLCPDGEYGDVHVSCLTQKLSPTQFALAKEMGWPSDARVREIVGMS